MNLPLGASVGLRINGVYEDGESFRRGVELERYGINPTFGLSLGEATRIDLYYEYFHDRRTTDRGVPAFNDRPLTGRRPSVLRRSRRQFLRTSMSIISASRSSIDFGRRPHAAQPDALFGL